MKEISMEGLDKADVLAALYNASKPSLLGLRNYDIKPMTREEAAALLTERRHRGCYFDYIKGRVMKVCLGYPSFDPQFYNRDNGEGVAERIINDLRANRDVNSTFIRRVHTEGIQSVQ